MSYLDQMKESDPNVEHLQGKFLRAVQVQRLEEDLREASPQLYRSKRLSVQAFDFESGLAVFNGMQALLG